MQICIASLVLLIFVPTLSYMPCMCSSHMYWFMLIQPSPWPPPGYGPEMHNTETVYLDSWESSRPTKHSLYACCTLVQQTMCSAAHVQMTCTGESTLTVVFWHVLAAIAIAVHKVSSCDEWLQHQKSESGWGIDITLRQNLCCHAVAPIYCSSYWTGT